MPRGNNSRDRNNRVGKSRGNRDGDRRRDNRRPSPHHNKPKKGGFGDRDRNRNDNDRRRNIKKNFRPRVKNLKRVEKLTDEEKEIKLNNQLKNYFNSNSNLKRRRRSK